MLQVRLLRCLLRWGDKKPYCGEMNIVEFPSFPPAWNKTGCDGGGGGVECLLATWYTIVKFPSFPPAWNKTGCDGGGRVPSRNMVHHSQIPFLPPGLEQDWL